MARPGVKALALVRNRGRILVFEGFDDVKAERFYRPLGGSVEFGERGEDAVDRELREEIGTGLGDVTFVGLIENHFTYRGSPGHEIVLLYSGSLADPSLYDMERIPGCDADGSALEVLWIDPGELDGVKLYPEGISAFVQV